MIDNSLITEIVSIAPCVLSVPKQHPLLKTQNISLADLKPYPFVMLSPKTWAGLLGYRFDFGIVMVSMKQF